MKRMCDMLTAAAALALVCAPAMAAEERGGFKELRGQFVRLTEQRVGERVYMGIVLKVEGAEKPVTVLVGPHERLVQKAKQLKEGQPVELHYIVKGENKWVVPREHLEQQRKPEAQHKDSRPRLKLRLNMEGRDKPLELDIPLSPEAIQKALQLGVGNNKIQLRIMRGADGKMTVVQQAGEAREGKQRPGRGAVHGRFVGRKEVAFREKEYLGLVVQPGEDREPVVVLVGRNEKLMARAHRLQKGQRVGIGYVVEGGQKWVQGIEADWREGEHRGHERREHDEHRERDGWRAQAREIGELFERLVHRMEMLEANVKELQQQNARLKEMLHVRGGDKAEVAGRELARLREENAKLRAFVARLRGFLEDKPRERE